MQPTQETDGNRLSTFSKIMLALAVPFLVVLGFSICFFVELRRVMVTRATLGQIQTASVAFQKMLGRWPVALPELINNTNGHVFFVTAAGGFVDGWNGPFLYVPPVGTNTGMIMSFGRDGMPGGAGHDADITVTLPWIRRGEADRDR